jgi:hypothetical protein
MSTSPSTPRSTEQGCDPVRLASYLSLGVTGALMATATGEAAIVMIDLTNVNGQNITGANAGLASGNFQNISNWLGVGTGTLSVYSAAIGPYWGLDGSYGLEFALSTPGFAKPGNFAAGTTIDAAATFSNVASQSSFRWGTFYTSPDFGANSFMGFRFGTVAGNYYFGYLEVTWNSSTLTFQILSGAYESTVNTAILAGATPPSGVPVPAASLLALMALGGNSFRRSRARAA